MAPNDEPKRARPVNPQSTSAQAQAARNKRKRAAAAEEGASSGDERSRGGKAAKVGGGAAGGAGGAARGGPATVSAVASGSKQPVAPTPEEERITKLDFNAFPSTSLRQYVLANGLMPRLDPSPYSDEPAPLPETLYKDPNAAPPPPPSTDDYPPPKRVAILADVQAAHEVLAKHAKEHWHKTQGNGPREGEVVTGFLYACKVGDRVLKIVPPSN